jgi:hypothetical protein
MRSDGFMDKNPSQNWVDIKVQKPIFIIGAPRSGLGVLYRILSSHDQVSIFDSNTILIRKFLRKSRRKRMTTNFISSLTLYRFYMSALRFAHRLYPQTKKDFSQYNEAHFWDKHFKSYIHSTDLDVSIEIADYYKSAVFRVQDDFSRPRFVSAMPEHSFRVVAIDAIFPDAKFIHIVRDLNIVACSTFAKVRDERSKLSGDSYFRHLYRILGNDRYNGSSELISYELAAQIIVKRAREANVFGSQRYLELQYEDLIFDPSQSLLRILSFCELCQSPEFVRKGCKIIRNENEKWYQYLNT